MSATKRAILLATRATTVQALFTIFSTQIRQLLPALSPPCPESSTLTLLLEKQIRPTTSQINDLRAPIPILLQPRTLKTIKRITYSLSSTNHAFILVVPERAFVADTDERCWTHVGVAHRTLAVAFVAEAADGDAWGFAAHYEITVQVC